MKRVSVTLAMVWLLGCEGVASTGGPDLGKGSAADTSSPASECNVAGAFQPPMLTLADLGSIMQKVLYFSSSPQAFVQLFTGEWTNWYNADMGTGLAKLATMRRVLERYNLHDTYLPGTRPQVDCTNKTSVRQIDGTCNDLVNTTAGAVGVRIGRNIPLFLPNPNSPTGYSPNPFAYPAPSDDAILTPSPREVSR